MRISRASWHVPSSHDILRNETIFFNRYLSDVCWRVLLRSPYGMIPQAKTKDVHHHALGCCKADHIHQGCCKGNKTCSVIALRTFRMRQSLACVSVETYITHTPGCWLCAHVRVAEIQAVACMACRVLWDHWPAYFEDHTNMKKMDNYTASCFMQANCSSWLSAATKGDYRYSHTKAVQAALEPFYTQPT